MIQYTEKTSATGATYIEGVDGDTLLIIPIDLENLHYQRYLESLDK